MQTAAIKPRNSYQIQYVDTNHLFVKPNALCVFETDQGIDLGRVFPCRRNPPADALESKGKLLRLATEEDLKRIQELESVERNAFAKCREKAAAKHLAMKLVTVKCLFDRTKIIFYFVAESRVDFRELVRELASTFRTRIEMRQIGVRDEARLTGGYGPCGKELCCVHQAGEFEPVSIKMAKEQNLNLNSLKISGMCGRLLCCLCYEFKLYREINEQMPKQGAEIRAGGLTYVVTGMDTMKETIQIRHGIRTVEIHRCDLERRDDAYFLRSEVAEAIAKTDKETLEEDSFTY